MQFDALDFNTRLIASYPESIIRGAELTDLHDIGASAAGARGPVVSQSRTGYEVLDPSKFPDGGETYTTLIKSKYDKIFLRRCPIEYAYI
jgi:hypothetical protein